MPPGAMKGRHYDPEIDGDWGTFKNERQAYRSRFQPGGDIFERNQKEDYQLMAALLNNPNMSDQEFAALLNSMGIYDIHEQRRSRFRSLMGAKNGTVLLNTNAVLDNGGYRDVGTSDLNKQGVWQGFDSPDARAANLGRQANVLQNRGLGEYLRGELGLGHWDRDAARGLAGVERDPESGYYKNVNPDGTITYYDDNANIVDPSTGDLIGNYYSGMFTSPIRRRGGDFTPLPNRAQDGFGGPPTPPGQAGIGPNEWRPYLKTAPTTRPGYSTWGAPRPQAAPTSGPAYSAYGGTSAPVSIRMGSVGANGLQPPVSTPDSPFRQVNKNRQPQPADSIPTSTYTHPAPGPIGTQPQPRTRGMRRRNRQPMGFGMDPVGAGPRRRTALGGF